MEGGSFDERVKNMCCRPSSTRWIPTTEQIRILRDLYYNSGLRSPSADQIQRISARLRQYGKIDGKNVFYWFQNHKARERQRKRYNELTSNTSTTCSSAKNNSSCNTNTNLSSMVMYGGGNNNTSHGYGSGSVLMERSFRESFIVGGGGCGGGDQHRVQPMEGNTNINTNDMCWNTTASEMLPMHQNRNYYSCSDYNAYQESSSSSASYRQMETLQLFPIHSNDQHQDEADQDQLKENNNESFYHMDCFFYEQHHEYSGNLGGGTSLELTLNSYYYAPPGSS